MEFIDHTGHIFSLSEYSEYPTGFEYSENPYVFWVSDEYNSYLSVDCFYIKPLYGLVKSDQFNSINVEIKNSKNFYLLSSSTIQEKLSKIYDSDGTVDWSKSEIELDFFTEEALELISNKEKSNNIKEEYSIPSSDFYKSININISDCVDVITEQYFFINDKGNIVDVVDETLINQNTSIGISFQDYDKDKFNESDFEHDYGYVYSNNDGDIISKKQWESLNEKSKLIYKRRNLAKRSIEYKMIPFYILANVKEVGTWLTNILITINNYGIKTYCPITVGGVFVDEQEELVINGKNMGIDLPKDICRALYNSSFWNEIPNMSLWNQKIKEYLLNYMKLKGERGNFSSAIQALKWFGYGDRLQLSALIQTDNQVINQYILDNFDLSFDVINEFRFFRYSTLLSLSIPGVVENPEGKTNNFEWNEDFWGEGKPKLHDRFKEYDDSKRYDEKDIEFLRPYYEWTFNEIGLKLCALKYYYKKYFLPIHLSIHRASITNQCFANDIKMLNVASNLVTERTFFAKDNNFFVKFPETKIVWYTDVTNYNYVIDPETWIYDSNIGDTNEFKSIYFTISDNCFSGDIDFIIKNFKDGDEHIFNCCMFVYQENNLLFKSNFSLYSKQEKYNIKFIIYPKYFNENFDMNFWLDKKYSIKLNVNGSWFDYDFMLKIPELDIEIGKLEYKYEYDVVKQFNGWDYNCPKFNSNMYLPEAVEINNLNFTNDLCKHIEDTNLTYLGKHILDGEIYYYTLNEDGSKNILTTGVKTIVLDNSGAYLVPNPYYTDVNNYSNELKNQLGIIYSPTKNIYSSVCRNITSLIDLYSVNLQIPKNLHLMNKIHIFNLLKKEYKYENGVRVNYNFNKVKYIKEESGNNKRTVKDVKKYEYEFGHETKWGEKYKTPSEYLKINYEDKEFTDNDSVFVKELYSYIFDENGNWNKSIEYFDKEWLEDIELKKYYDIYLMHDFDYWYVILISKNTIADNSDLYNITDNKIYRIGFNEDYNNEYYIEYDRSDEKFLINRMNFSKMDGVYHFKTTDTIAARLNNFKNLPIRLKIGSRWSFTPMLLNSNFEKHFDSPTNIGIMSIGEGNPKAPKGYYRVNVKYSVDNFVNEYQARSTKILIDDSLESISYPEIVNIPKFIPIKTKQQPVIRYYIYKNNDLSNRYQLPDIDGELLYRGFDKTTGVTHIIYITVNEFENASNENFVIHHKTGNIEKTDIYNNTDKLFSFTLDNSNSEISKSIVENGTLYSVEFNIIENDIFYGSEIRYINIIELEDNSTVFYNPFLTFRNESYVTGNVLVVNKDGSSSDLSWPYTLKDFDSGDHHIYVNNFANRKYLAIQNKSAIQNDAENKIKFLVSYSFVNYIPDEYDYKYIGFTQYNSKQNGITRKCESFIISIENIPEVNGERVISIACYNENRIIYNNSQYIIHII